MQLIEENIKYKLIDHTDFENIQLLYNKTFGKNLSTAYFKKKFNTEIYGCQPISSIAYDGNKAIAFFGVIPQYFKHQEKKIFVATTADYITLPAYRRKGINQKLAALSYTTMEEQGVQFLTMFFNEISFSKINLSDWTRHETLNCLFIQSNNLPIQRLLHKLKLGSFGYKILKNKCKPHLYFPKELENPYAFDANNVYQEYDALFLAYKSFGKHVHVKINQSIFWLRITGVAYIGLASGTDATTFIKDFDQLIKLLQKAGFDKIIYQFSSHAPHHEKLKQEWNTQPSYSVGYKVFNSNLSMQNLRLNYADIDSF